MTTIKTTFKLMSLILPGKGTVHIRDVSLYQYAPDENPLESAGQ